MVHPDEALRYTMVSTEMAHQLFRVAMQAAEAGVVDPAGDVTLAHVDSIEEVQPNNTLSVDDPDVVPGEDPDWMVIVRPRPRMESVERLAGMINESVLGARPEPFVRRAPTGFQQRMEAWAARGRGVRRYLGRAALARGWGYDAANAPIQATDPLAQRVLELNGRYGEIVTPGAQPADNYTLTLLRRGANDTVREDEVNLVWNGIRPIVVASDRELADREHAHSPVSLERIAQFGVVMLGGARVLQPEYALELRQRGPRASIIGAEAAETSAMAHGVLQNVLGVGPELIARQDATHTVTYLVAREHSEPEAGQLNVHDITVAERHANTHPNMTRHTIGDYTSTERSVITAVALDPVEETNGETLRVWIENVYDLHTGELMRWRVQYGTSNYTAGNLPFGNARLRGVALPPEQRARVHAAIAEQLQPDRVRERFERF